MTNKFIEQRVETLENELSELKLIVAQIRKPSTEVSEALSATTVEDKPFFSIPEPAKTINQLRAEIIEKAKGFVESRMNREQLVPWKCGTGQWYLRNFEFVVDEPKRTIVVLCKSDVQRRIYKRSIAKCMPSDVFNSHIGKAIALGRALGLDVSEFEQAVQPTFAVGQIVRNKDGEVSKTITHKGIFGSAWYRDCGTWNHEHKMLIINDTNAIYGGVE